MKPRRLRVEAEEDAPGRFVVGLPRLDLLHDRVDVAETPRVGYSMRKSDPRGGTRTPASEELRRLAIVLMNEATYDIAPQHWTLR